MDKHRIRDHHFVKNRFLTSFLCVAMIVSSAGMALPVSADSVVSSSGDTSSVSVASSSENEEIASETVVSDSEVSSESDTSSEDTSAETEQTADSTNEKQEVTEEDRASDTSGMDFSSMRLIAGTEDASVIRSTDNVISDYDGVYLLQYDSEDAAREAYDYYSGKTDFVAPDSELQAADDADVIEGEEVQADVDALTALSEAVEDAGSGQDENKASVNTQNTKVVAVLDTGYTPDDITSANVIDAVSMLGDETADDNGHATKVINEIVGSNPAAYLMSIKVLDKNGKGNTSSVYAGIQYAMQQGAGIIVMPMYAYSTADNEAIEEAINEAVSQGITVIGAAGNDGNNVKYYVPGKIDGAVIVGACDQDGNRLASSNYGDTVDYYVAQTSTSLATAEFAGVLSAYGNSAYEDVADNLKDQAGIFTPDEITDSTVAEADLSVDTSGIFSAADHTSLTVNSEHDSSYYSTAGFGGGWNTSLFTTTTEDGSVNDHTYCIDPSKHSPAKRTYTNGVNGVSIYTVNKSNAGSFTKKKSPTDSTPDGSFSSYTMVLLLYYGYGGPGHNQIAAKYRSTNGGTISKARDICLTHIALAQQANWCVEFGVSLGSLEKGLSGNSLQYVIEYIQYIQNIDHSGMDATDWEMIITKTGSYQSLARASFNKEQVKGYLAVQKNSGNTSVTDSNSCYSLAGAKFNVLKEDKKTVVTTLTTNDKGYAESGELDQGTYYLTETDPSSGYSLTTTDGNMKKIEVTGDNTKDKPATWTCAEPPMNDPANFTIRKKNAVLGTGSTVCSLEGAQFTINYYAGQYQSSNLPAKPTRTWVLSTDKDGYAELQDPDTYLVKDKSDDLYYEDGKVVIPLGTITMTESAPADGYTLDGAVFKAYKGSDQVASVTSGTFLVNIVDENSGVQMRAQNKAVDEDGFIVEEQPVYGGVKIYKRDYETKDTKAQGNAELSGARFEIISNNDYAVSAKDAQGNLVTDAGGNAVRYSKGQTVLTITTDSNGYAATAAHQLESGSYIIREAQAPTGYLGEGVTEKTFTIPDTEEANKELVDLTDENSSISNQVKRGGFLIVKADNELDASSPEGDADLKDTEYTITNTSDKAVEYHSLDGSKTMLDPGDTTVIRTVLVTEDNCSSYGGKDYIGKYVAATAEDALPYGSYSISETKAPTGYLNAKWTASVTISEDKQFTSYNDDSSKWNKNKVMRGNIIAAKTDRETSLSTSLGAAHLEGATFELINRSENAVYVSGKTYQPGEVIRTVKAEWDASLNRYIADFGEGLDGYEGSHKGKVFPYGTYEIRETGTGEGYLFDSTSEDYSKTVSIRSDGQLVDASGEADACANQVIREDFEFTKKEETTDKEMGYVVFQVTSQTTGETHFIVTDENGYYNSEYNAATGFNHKHSEKTNINDPDSPISNGSIGKNADGTYYVADASKLDPEAGTWFTGVTEKTAGVKSVKWNKDGSSYTITMQNGKSSSVKVRDDLRAFPYDTYTIKELRCPANEGKNLVNVTITLHRYDDPDGNGVCVDYGTLYNEDVTVQTTLTADSTESHIGQASSDADLTDAVTMGGLLKGKAYTVTGELHKVSSDGKDEGVIASETITFKAKAKNETHYVHFEGLDLSDMGDSHLVAFEYLYQGLELMASHEDLEDEGQTVSFMNIHTTAKGDVDDESCAEGETITIVDTVAYSNVKKGRIYHVNGTLHIKNEDGSDGGVLKDADGNDVTATAWFLALRSEGTVDVTFRFSNPGNLAGKNVVAFEDLVSGDIQYAAHEDISDEGQDIHFPKIETTATDAEEGGHETAQAEEVTINDEVAYENLTVGKTYTMTGVLHIKDSDGTDLGVLEGSERTVEFTPEKSSGKVTISFDVDTTALGGKDLVAFETLERENIELAAHADITDEGQTVHVPEIHTTAVGDDTETHQLSDAEEVTIVDTVAYQNLLPETEYTVDGTLMIAPDEDDENAEVEALLDRDGNEVKASTSFTTPAAGEDSETVSGTIEVPFTFTVPSDFAGKTVVAFETLSREDRSLVVHADINDEAQTTYEMDIHTTLTGEDGTAKEIKLGPATLIDTVEYENLVPGDTYCIKGRLVYSDGKTVQKDGKDVTAETTFVPEEPDGTAELSFDVDTSDQTDGCTIVAFEYAYSENGTEIGRHEDLEDKDQTVTFPSIHTEAEDNDVNDHQISDKETVTINDTVKYTNLQVGAEYTITGTLHIRKTDEDGNVTDGGVPKDKDGRDVTAQTTFTAEKTDGEITVPFTFDVPSDMDGKTLVAFETLTREDVELAVHADISDESQTTYKGEIHTSLADSNGKKTVTPASETKLTDTVKYSNLIAGKAYKMKGVLVDGNGNALKDKDGKEITAETEFTPDKADGSVQITFTVDTTSMKDGDKIVAYEYASLNDVEIAKHEDSKDEDQTVTIHVPTAKKSKTIPQTGDVDILPVGVSVLAAAAALMAFLVFKKRKRQ